MTIMFFKIPQIFFYGKSTMIFQQQSIGIIKKYMFKLAKEKIKKLNNRKNMFHFSGNYWMNLIY